MSSTKWLILLTVLGIANVIFFTSLDNPWWVHAINLTAALSCAVSIAVILVERW